MQRLNFTRTKRSEMDRKIDGNSGVARVLCFNDFFIEGIQPLCKIRSYTVCVNDDLEVISLFI